tara:strand:+ start:1051 stop:1161 length:111 start_codon:yes stop_codon:yes gene_type:complete
MESDKKENRKQLLRDILISFVVGMLLAVIAAAWRYL